MTPAYAKYSEKNYATLREKQHILGMRYHVQQLAFGNHD
jgi:hypothetical protein